MGVGEGGLIRVSPGPGKYYTDQVKWVTLNNNNNNVHLSCADQRPERSRDTY